MANGRGNEPQGESVLIEQPLRPLEEMTAVTVTHPAPPELLRGPGTQGGDAVIRPQGGRSLRPRVGKRPARGRPWWSAAARRSEVPP